MSWSVETLARARSLIDRYPQKRSAIMPLLYIAMREDGYLTEDGMRQVAELTGLTPVQVESVASFYGMFKLVPQGEYLVSVCTSIVCMLNSADDVMTSAEEEAGVPAGETDADGVVTVEHVECIGACGGAPAVQVNYELVEGVSPDAVAAMIRWLRETKPTMVTAAELQERFGGARSFDPAIAEPQGAVGPFPAFDPYGTAGGAS
ncbi:NADH-quinone oxidoreductase subunit E [bacterium BMS3Abin02]|nr:NADH-quinone oxidoreductase subunit E [bacterium BMS3Abin02]HDL50223.1 NAD(P)H-dependent oxidoreductase subunit E [Actinomycetota bacterium]